MVAGRLSPPSLAFPRRALTGTSLEVVLDTGLRQVRRVRAGGDFLQTLKIYRALAGSSQPSPIKGEEGQGEAANVT